MINSLHGEILKFIFETGYINKTKNLTQPAETTLISDPWSVYTKFFSTIIKEFVKVLIMAGKRKVLSL